MQDQRQALLSPADDDGFSISAHHNKQPPVPPSFVRPLLLAIFTCQGSVAFGFQLGFTSPISSLPTAPAIFDGQFDTFSSLISIGAMAGGLLGGPIADWIGRKNTILLNAIPFVASMVGVYFAQNIATLLACRLIVGFAAGVASLTVPMYVTECSPTHLRGALGASGQLGVTTGILMAYIAGLPIPNNNDWWREMALIGLIPLAIQILGVLLLFPESPVWLIANDKPRAVIDKAFVRIRGAGYDASAEIMEIRSSMNGEATGSFLELFSRRMMRPLIVAVGLQVLQQATGINAVIFFTGKIFQLADLDAVTSTIIVGVVQVVVTFISCMLLDRAGRRPLLILAAAGMGISQVLLGFCFQFPDTMPHWMPIAATCLDIAFFSIAMGPVPWFITAEVFPSHVRGKAMSVATVVNWLGAFAIVQATTPLFHASASGAFWMFGGVCIFAIVFVVAIVPETKGKSFEQIDAEFQGRSLSSVA